MSLLPIRILNMELNRQSKEQAIVLEPATSYRNITFHLINGKFVRTCLCDTRARACVLPKMMADKIGIIEYEETNALMTMIDGTTTRPLGKESNVEVKMDPYMVLMERECGVLNLPQQVFPNTPQVQGTCSTSIEHKDDDLNPKLNTFYRSLKSSSVCRAHQGIDCHSTDTPKPTSTRYAIQATNIKEKTLK